MSAPEPFRPVVNALEDASALDAPAKAVGKTVRGIFSPGRVKDAISGTWLGHALHPLLTDVVIGSFLSASLLDAMGGDDAAVERLLSVGIASYAPTALTGVNDWADSEIADDAVRRVGLVHATINLSALTLYAGSLIARRGGAASKARRRSLAGAAVLTVGGYLGGHLSYTRGVGTNQTAFDLGSDEWSTAAASADVRPDEPKRVVVGDTPVVLLRRGGALHAIHDRCSHRGCSLSEGEWEGETVTCPCHGSMFDVHDGSVIRGPASAGQPFYRVREQNGAVEVSLAGRG